MSEPQKDFFEWKHEQGQQPTPYDITVVSLENKNLPSNQFEECVWSALATVRANEWATKQSKNL